MNLLCAYLLTLLLAHLAQWLLPKQLRPDFRAAGLWVVQITLVTGLFIVNLLVFSRPWLAGVLTLAALAVFLVVNQAKFKALQEPLVFSDVYLYLQVFSHPRLFLPFLHIPLTLAAIAAGLLLMGLAIWLEPALNLHAAHYAGLVLTLLTGGLVMTRLAGAFTLRFEPVQDVITLGFYNSLLLAFLQARSPLHREALHDCIQQNSPFLPKPAASAPAKRPNLVVVQSESFFDARRLSQAIRPTLLQHFDRIGAESLSHGQLQVPAWGANTLRPEFAFLSGIDNALLGHYRYNPYQFLRQTPSPTLASYLKSLGYRCICVHPNDRVFFKRYQVFPLFGFDEFIDISAFGDSPRSGPYIADSAVSDKIRELLARYNGQPVFIFAITMENHGPLHLENCEPGETERYYQGQVPRHHQDLTIYLRHLQHADQMLNTLTQTLQQADADAWLCWYGDHIPSMPQVYASLDFRNGHSDYLLWHNRRKTVPALNKTLAIHELASTLLQSAQLMPRNG